MGKGRGEDLDVANSAGLQRGPIVAAKDACIRECEPSSTLRVGIAYAERFEFSGRSPPFAPLFSQFHHVLAARGPFISHTLLGPCVTFRHSTDCFSSGCLTRFSSSATREKAGDKGGRRPIRHPKPLQSLFRRLLLNRMATGILESRGQR